MANEVAKPMSPMEEFQENLKKSLRDDIARMLPDAAVAELIKRVIEEEFFKKRQMPKPGRAGYSSETIEVPSAFQDMVIKAAMPIMEREAAKLVAKFEYVIADQIKEIVEHGVAETVMKVLSQTLMGAFQTAEVNWRTAIVEQLKRNGLQINVY